MSQVHDYAYPLLNAPDKMKSVKLFDLPASYQFINRDDELDCDASARETILKAFDDPNVESLAILYDQEKNQLRSIYTSENSIDDMTPRGGDFYGKLPLNYYRGEHLVGVSARIVRGSSWARVTMLIPENATRKEISEESSNRAAYLDSLDDELDFHEDIFAAEGTNKPFQVESISIRKDFGKDLPVVQFRTILSDIPVEEKQEVMLQDLDVEMDEGPLFKMIHRI